MENAYQAPRAEVVPVVSEQSQLFTPGQIAAAAFFGSLAASAWLARANYIALGEPAKGNSTLIKGALVTIGIIVLALVLPEQIPGMVYTLPQLFLARKLADTAFGPLVSLHPKASNWRVAGVSFVSLLLFTGSVIGISMALEPAAFAE